MKDQTTYDKTIVKPFLDNLDCVVS